MPITLPLRSAKVFNSGLLTSQNTGRRKLIANTFTGAPRGIARITLPTEPSALTSPDTSAAIAAVARTCTSCGSRPSSRKKPRSCATKRSIDAMLRLE